MKSLKNNVLVSQDKNKLCKTHNGNNRSLQKVKLSIYKSCNCAKTYHPLKRKKIKLHKIKFVSNIANRSLLKTIKFLETTGDPILSRRYRSNVSSSSKRNDWSNEEEIINWLTSIGIKIKRINSCCFILKNKTCSFNYIVIFANKKRVELGLNPFYIEGVTEY